MSYRNEIINQHYVTNYDRLVKRTVWRVPHRSTHLAEECVQEAYARALFYFRTFDPERDLFERWFEGILRNSINSCRTQEADRGVSIDDGDDDTAISPDKHERETAVFIVKSMEDGQKKDILKLFLLYGYKTKDIAIYLGLNHNTVRQIISRWRDKLE